MSCVEVQSRRHLVTNNFTLKIQTSFKIWESTTDHLQCSALKSERLESTSESANQRNVDIDGTTWNVHPVYTNPYITCISNAATLFAILILGFFREVRQIIRRCWLRHYNELWESRWVGRCNILSRARFEFHLCNHIIATEVLQLNAAQILKPGSFRQEGWDEASSRIEQLSRWVGRWRIRSQTELCLVYWTLSTCDSKANFWVKRV
jgi:hypothetical protein